MSSPSPSAETKASAPAASAAASAPSAHTPRKARYDRTLHLASQPPPPSTRGATVLPVLHADIPPPIAARAPAAVQSPAPSADAAVPFPEPSRAHTALAPHRHSSPIDRFFARLAAWLEGLVARFAR